MSGSTDLAEALDGVAGWLMPNEAWALHEAARRAASAPGEIVEIGTYRGRSAIALALGVESAGARKTVHTIDPFVEGEPRAEFLANLQRANVADLVASIQATSHAARPLFRDGTVNVLFVDGSHEYADVLQDIDDWTPALSANAVAAFNDPFLPGVRRALAERVLRFDSSFVRPRLIDNTLFVDLSPGGSGDAVRKLAFRIMLPLGTLWRARIRPLAPGWLKPLPRRIADRLAPIRGAGGKSRTRP